MTTYINVEIRHTSFLNGLNIIGRIKTSIVKNVIHTDLTCMFYIKCSFYDLIFIVW
jgi:hypothetical protein